MRPREHTELKKIVDENKEGIVKYFQTGDEKFLRKPTVEEKKLNDIFKEKVIAYSQTGEEKLWIELTMTVKETKSSTEVENLINAFDAAKNYLYEKSNAEILPDALSSAVAVFAVTTPPSMCCVGIREGIKNGLGLGIFGGIMGAIRSTMKPCDRNLSMTLRIIDRNIATLSDMLEIHSRQYINKEAQIDRDNFSTSSHTFGLRNRS